MIAPVERRARSPAFEDLSRYQPRRSLVCPNQLSNKWSAVTKIPVTKVPWPVLDGVIPHQSGREVAYAGRSAGLRSHFPAHPRRYVSAK
jgi:hypothetical protein